MDEERENLDLEGWLRRTTSRFDALPGGLLDVADAAFEWRTVDAELAELTADSLVEREFSGVLRGRPAPRFLVFRTDIVGIEVEITAAGHSFTMIGQLDPAGPATIEIRHPNGSVTVQADELGLFTVHELPAGPISLLCRLPDSQAAPITTEWISL
jgi:hypothetical protein